MDSPNEDAIYNWYLLVFTIVFFFLRIYSTNLFLQVQQCNFWSHWETNPNLRMFNLLMHADPGLSSCWLIQNQLILDFYCIFNFFHLCNLLARSRSQILAIFKGRKEPPRTRNLNLLRRSQNSFSIRSIWVIFVCQNSVHCWPTNKCFVIF